MGRMEANDIKIIHIDLDTNNGLDLLKWKKEYLELRDLAKNILGIKLKVKSIFKTINGFHIYIEIKNLPKLKEKELSLFLNNLEVILNSDKKRAIFNLLRILHNWEWKHSSILFKETELNKIRKKEVGLNEG
jgi:hypothetical protein